jgi:subtilisin family serine protease
VDPLDALPQADDLLDYAAGHGTFVAGIVQQVAPGAEIAMYRALESDGVGTELGVACALVRAVKAGAKIVNLSVGGQTRFDSPSLPIAAALDEITKYEAAPGATVIIASAGNYGDTRPTWPAAFRRVVSVGAVAADLHPTAWSSRGFWVDCASVGEGILSTFVEGRESYEFTGDPDTFGTNPFARWSGTSFAAPQVAGAVARLMQEHDLTARQALARLLAGGRPVPDFGQALSILPGL